MDRFDAEALLENKPEGTFLLRDSAQNDYLFSVSFRRYNRSLHARIEQMNHMFSFDAYDNNVYSAATVTEVIEYYKDPAVCMFFEPLLTNPLPRKHVFSLQHLSRAVICDSVRSYQRINELDLPKKVKEYLKDYHYKHVVFTRKLDV